MTVDLCIKYLTYTGFWPPSHFTGWKLILYYCYTLISFVFVLGIFILIQIVDLYNVWGNIPLMTADAFLLFTNLCQAFKMINILLRRKRVERIICTSENQIEEYKTNETIVIVDKYSKLASKYLIVYCSLTFLVLILWMLGPITVPDKELPIPAWYPYNTEISPAYELTYIHQIIAIFLAASLNIMKDSLTIGLMNKAACQIKLLKFSLENISNDISYNVSDCEIINRLKLLIVRHTNTLYIIRQIEECFGLVILIQFSISLIIICVSAFQLGEQIHNGIVNSLGILIYLLVMVFQLFIVCWHGNEIKHQSETLMESAYFCLWYNYSFKFKNVLLIFMIQSTRTINLTAYGIVAISIKTFMAIIKTSYSLFTVLQQANKV